jgi:hypothetical protein
MNVCKKVLCDKPVSLPRYVLTETILPYNLQRANLQWADLQRANLHGTNLRWANLQGAKLQGAELRGADLQGADLTNTGVSLLQHCGKFNRTIINNNGVLSAGCFRGSVEEFKTAVVQKYGSSEEYHPELETFLNKNGSCYQHGEKEAVIKAWEAKKEG